MDAFDHMVLRRFAKTEADRGHFMAMILNENIMKMNGEKWHPSFILRGHLIKLSIFAHILTTKVNRTL